MKSVGANTPRAWGESVRGPLIHRGNEVWAAIGDNLPSHVMGGRARPAMNDAFRYKECPWKSLLVRGLWLGTP